MIEEANFNDCSEKAITISNNMKSSVADYTKEKEALIIQRKWRENREKKAQKDKNSSDIQVKEKDCHVTLENEEKPLQDDNIPKNETKFFDSGAVYNGEVLKGLRHGKGIFQWKDGSKYEGEWKDDMANGKGKFMYSNGDRYEGTWVDDKAEGFGIFMNSSGAKYEGTWRGDKQSGFGIETLPNGSRFEGNFIDGKKSGNGKYIWKDGSTYEGNWSNNIIHDFVVISF